MNESLNIIVTNNKHYHVLSKWYVLSKVVRIFNIYQTHNSNPIYNCCTIKRCFKIFDQSGKSSAAVGKIQHTNLKFISTQ